LGRQSKPIRASITWRSTTNSSFFVLCWCPTHKLRIFNLEVPGNFICIARQPRLDIGAHSGAQRLTALGGLPNVRQCCNTTHAFSRNAFGTPRTDLWLKQMSIHLQHLAKQTANVWTAIQAEHSATASSFLFRQQKSKISITDLVPPRANQRMYTWTAGRTCVANREPCFRQTDSSGYTYAGS